MSWSMPHRVVTRDENGRIVKNVPCEHFAEGKPIYDAAVKDLPDGHSVCLYAASQWPLTKAQTLSKGTTVAIAIIAQTPEGE